MNGSLLLCVTPGSLSELFMDTEISFMLNGRSRTITTDPDRPLLEVLREDLQLTGSKFGCGEGQCRACTVIINGQSTPSCITPVGDVGEQSVLTIEGLATDGKLHPVQQAFLDEGAFQCGYCTAGMIMGVTAVIKNNPKATEAEVLSELERHICRCCSYAGYRKAVRRVLAVAQAEKARI
jgi:aerobic-type carbon monoxide dehydrogenase small subunit (CoxS/CutS family)